jgi:hypothetical protein
VAPEPTLCAPSTHHGRHADCAVSSDSNDGGRNRGGYDNQSFDDFFYGVDQQQALLRSSPMGGLRPNRHCALPPHIMGNARIVRFRQIPTMEGGNRGGYDDQSFDDFFYGVDQQQASLRSSPMGGWRPNRHCAPPPHIMGDARIARFRRIPTMGGGIGADTTINRLTNFSSHYYLRR